MIDLIKKGLLVGLGSAVVTKEKLEEGLDALVKKGNLTKDEAASWLKDMESEGDDQAKVLKAEFDELLTASLDKLNLVKKSSVDKLEAEVAELKQRLANLEK